MKFTLRIWRQENREAAGRLTTHVLDDIEPDMSFLEMLDILNERLEAKGETPIAFDSDCREGICGTCSLVIDGHPHGPRQATTTCQLYMREFPDGATIVVEPFRARAFPIVRDLVIDRQSFETVVQAGGYVTVKTGSAPDANAMPIAKQKAALAFEAAQCIGCGACVAACPNSSAMLYVGAKAAHFAHLPQGQPERRRRALNMVSAMDRVGFGNCTNHGMCATACPVEIPLRVISELNRDFLTAAMTTKASGELTDKELDE